MKDACKSKWDLKLTFTLFAVEPVSLFRLFVGISKATEYGRGVFVRNLSLEELLSINISDSV